MTATWALVAVAICGLVLLNSIHTALQQIFKQNLGIANLLAQIEGRLEISAERLYAIEQHTRIAVLDEYSKMDATDD